MEVGKEETDHERNLRWLDKIAWEKHNNRPDGKNERLETVERHGHQFLQAWHMMMVMTIGEKPADVHHKTKR